MKKTKMDIERIMKQIRPSAERMNEVDAQTEMLFDMAEDRNVPVTFITGTVLFLEYKNAEEKLYAIMETIRAFGVSAYIEKTENKVDAVNIDYQQYEI